MTNREANRGQQDIKRAAPPARVPDVFSANNFKFTLTTILGQELAPKHLLERNIKMVKIVTNSFWIENRGPVIRP